jgi:hypothetical protein
MDGQTWSSKIDHIFREEPYSDMHPKGDFKDKPGKLLAGFDQGFC